MGKPKRHLSIATYLMIISITLTFANTIPPGIPSNGYNYTCPRYEWKPFNQLTPNDIVLPTGRDVNSNTLYSCRFPLNGKMAVGKASLNQNACWVSNGDYEVGSRGSLTFEVLTTTVNFTQWDSYAKGEPVTLPDNYVVGGPEIFIAQCGWETGWGYENTPGAYYLEEGKALVPWGGRARRCDSFKLLIQWICLEPGMAHNIY